MSPSASAFYALELLHGRLLLDLVSCAISVCQAISTHAVGGATRLLRDNQARAASAVGQKNILTASAPARSGNGFEGLLRVIPFWAVQLSSITNVSSRAAWPEG